jgi:hypothetical protein
MVAAGIVCVLVALVVLLNIEAWRRRTVAELHTRNRRAAARERAWQAVTGLERER